jgi:hypothetical protein
MLCLHLILFSIYLNTGIRNHNNIKIIVPKELKLKKTQKVIGKPIIPKCQLKWDTFYEKQLIT